MRLDVLKFSRDDLDRWIIVITEYFSLLNTPTDQCLWIVGFNLEGMAAEWFQWMSRNASPKIKGSLNADEDIGVNEDSSVIDGIFDMGESNMESMEVRSKFGEFLDNKKSMEEVVGIGEALRVGEDDDSGNVATDEGDDAISSHTWEDLTTTFPVNLFQPRRTEKLLQIFYDHVNPATRRTIDQSAGGKIRDRNAKESWALLEDLTLYDNERWNDLRDFAKPVKAISLAQDVPSTSNCRLIKLKNQVQRLMEAHLAPKKPIQVNKITSSCEICSGPYDTQYYMKNT
ncbi:hypothetical protein Tco_1525535 [Tanacetum coccineum]